MRYGQVYGSGYGDPDNHVAWLDLQTDDQFVYVQFAPAANFGDAYFSVYRNSKLVTRLWIAGEDPSPVIPVAREKSISNSILVLRDGQLSDINFMNIDLVRSFEQGNSRPTIRWQWDYFVAGSDDDYTDNWDLTGLKWSDTQQTQIFKAQSDVSFSLDVTGSNVVVTVYVGETVLLTGSGSFPGTIALSGSGLSGTVDVLSGATDSTGKVRLVWPDSMVMYRTDSGGTILTTLGTKAFNYQDSATIQESNDLSNGTYYYKGKFASATDDTDMSGYTAVANVVISNSPEPVTNLAVAAGGTAADTSLEFTTSTTAGATYRLYLQRIGADRIDLYTIEATSSSSPITLPTITGYPGTVRALVKAVSAGNEDNYLTAVDVVYDAAGDVVYSVPNIPQIDLTTIRYASGNLQVPVLYNPVNEEGVATGVKLYYRASPADAWSLFGSATLGSLQNGVKKASFNVTGLSANMYYFSVAATTDAGSESDKSSSTQAFECGSYTVTAPTLTIDLARS